MTSSYLGGEVQADLDHPAGIMRRLTEIENDLAIRQNTLESAARRWFLVKRDLERDRALKTLQSTAKTITEKRVQADAAVFDLDGAQAEYEAVKAVVRVLETRASIAQSLLKAHQHV